MESMLRRRIIAGYKNSRTHGGSSMYAKSLLITNPCSRSKKNIMSKTALTVVLMLFIAMFFAGRATAQSTSYAQTNLVSDGAVTAPNTDKHLINPWGIAFVPGGPFWISDH